jgi:hypothetical protein
MRYSNLSCVLAQATSRPSTGDSTARWSWQKIDIPVVPVTEIKVERKKGSALFSLPRKYRKYIRMASSRAKFDKAEWSNDQVGPLVALWPAARECVQC